MKWFSNLKIRTKLISCFIILALLTAVVGLIGINNMRVINSRADAMYKDDLVPSQNLAQVQRNLLYVRSNLLLIIYERDVSLLQQRMEEIDQWSQETTDLLNNYERTLKTDNEKQLFKTTNTSLISYRELRTRLINMIQQGKYDEAIAMIPETTAARVKVETGINDLITAKTESAQASAEKSSADFTKQSTMMIAIIIIGLICAIIFGLFVANIISKPLNRLVGAANQMAKGDLDVTIHAHTTDEVGVLTQAFSTMAENTNRVLTNINTAAGQVTSGARQVSDSSIALSQGAAEQASSIEELTASIEEIAAHTRQNADNANDAKDFAEAAKTNAFEGNQQMQEMLTSMDEINEASGNIFRIIKVIDEIAFQTNILALNAAVEAARAGQHGKGFAVVAEEVRNLAARSANAAKETTVLIESSMKKVESGTKIANETASALNKIVDGIAKVTNLVGDIATASTEQATGIAQINQGIMQVSQVVQTNSATSEESAAASEELSQQAALLKEQVNLFNLKHRYSDYSGLEEVTPEVLKALDSLNDNKKFENSIYRPEAEKMTTASSRIKLSDHEFGKY